MAILQSIDYRTYKRLYGCRIPVAYGAGDTVRDFDFSEFQRVKDILSHTEKIYDRAPEKTGKKVMLCGKELSICGLDNLISCARDMTSSHIMILMLCENKILEVMEFLDKFPELDKMICFSFFDIVKWEYQRDEIDIMEPESDDSSLCIPRIIHYCWFGENKIPQKNLKYIESWKKCCRDYEIKFWNEENYDLSMAPQFVKEAYAHKKYSFVSDYVRLDILYREGGIYLDTDVELFDNFNKLLGYKAFFAFENRNLINTGLGFGSVSGNKYIGELRKLYNDAHFINSKGKFNIIACPFFQTSYFQFLGVEINDTTQVMDDMIFLSSNYLCSFNQDDGQYILSDRSIGIHHYDCSWFDYDEKKNWDEKKALKEACNLRLWNDLKKICGK